MQRLYRRFSLSEPVLTEFRRASLSSDGKRAVFRHVCCFSQVQGEHHLWLSKAAFFQSRLRETEGSEMILSEMILSDVQIREAVLRELRWEPRIKGSNIGVAVDNGVVRLVGTVGTSTEKLAVVEAALRVIRVVDVVDEIEVRIPEGSRTDPDIARAVEHALLWNAHIPHERIRFTVSNGWVALEGRVEFTHERLEAERTVRRLSGVRGVYNEIVVDPPEVKTENVRQAIEEALRREAELEAENIRVSLKGDTVNLKGRVHSWQEKQMILNAVVHSPGVRRIDDHLSIDPYF
jgi:osmotically-inducible protein OsmY